MLNGVIYVISVYMTLSYLFKHFTLQAISLVVYFNFFNVINLHIVVDRQYVNIVKSSLI